ncbi:Aste57867_14469 [Aphanomyces stellatus]|uniref:Aste57867_14469 protein n=1 Tax=Aphanomyces stellatus TaxID=120398 RepID=A0A485L0Q2_9STRA|nr:hypothetical protein As57867_014415 [Aphanomyces stellatus]VFT91291.1 Aste57867_14469 [Aphanomyces stellatus]
MVPPTTVICAGSAMEALLGGPDLVAYAQDAANAAKTKRMPLSHAMPGLFLAGAAPAKRLDLLQAHAISAVVNVGGGACPFPQAVEYLKIGVLDTGSTSMLPHFHATSDFIHRHVMEGRNVLVHCRGGFSRSPAVVAAYLVKYRRVSVDDALLVCRLGHPRSNPRANFLDDLHVFASSLE